MQLAPSEHQGEEPGHQREVYSSQEPEHDAQIQKGLPEVEDYVNEETRTAKRSKNGESGHNRWPRLDGRINSEQSNDTWLQHPRLDQTMGTQRAASDGALAVERGMENIIRSAEDDNSLNISESMYCWWEIGQTPMDSNVFPGFDIEIMDSTF